MPYPTLPGRRFEYDIGGGSVYVGVKTNGTTSEAMVALTSEQMAGLNGIQKVSPVISIAAGFAQTKEITVWVFLPEQYVVAGLGMDLTEALSSLSARWPTIDKQKDDQ